VVSTDVGEEPSPVGWAMGDTLVSVVAGDDLPPGVERRH
jgi:hypothetical protein